MKIKHWISDAIEVKLSGMEGKGVYAARTIKENEVIGVFGGIVVPENEIEDLMKTVPPETLKLDHAMYIYPGILMVHDYENGCDPLCFVNHSCDPSTRIENGIVLVADRDIRAGEEISWNYRETDDVGNWTYEFKCRCGSPNCEGMIQIGPQYRAKVKAMSN
jgi:SET domain-containing protein